MSSIEKVNNVMKSEENVGIYEKEVVLIFDECEGWELGEGEKEVKKKLKKYYELGFSGRGMFGENGNGWERRGSVLGGELDWYVISDGIGDEKVLKFKVD